LLCRAAPPAAQARRALAPSTPPTLGSRRQQHLPWAALQRRDLLGSADYGLRQQRIQNEQDALFASEDVTATLRRTRQMMAQNIEQAAGNLSVLDSSTAKLMEARDELRCGAQRPAAAVACSCPEAAATCSWRGWEPGRQAAGEPTSSSGDG
jgi:hypothetical protein